MISKFSKELKGITKARNHIPDIRKKVEEAKELLKRYFKDEETSYADFIYAAQNLLNALEEKALVNSNIQEIPISSKVNYTRESIWKPISELYKVTCHSHCYVRFKSDGIKLLQVYDNHFYDVGDSCEDVENSYSNHSAKEFCSLADFINQQEQNTKDIAELKQLIKTK